MVSVEELKEQHVLNYRNAVIEIINNNTDALFDEDIKSLFKVPPLDSMDLLKTKIISIAKKENSVINSNKLSEYMDKYRNEIYELLEELKRERKELLIKIIEGFDIDKGKLLKINKKDFLEFDKKAKKNLQNVLEKLFEKYLLKNVNQLFTKNINENDDSSKELYKYFKNYYIKQILENYDFKVLVKNTILINNIKEQGERYNFTLENSHLFNE